jgi:uncharacterized protein YjiS (DUF1127 family)
MTTLTYGHSAYQRSPSAFTRRVGDVFHKWAVRARTRRELAQLAALEPHLLKDIGVSPSDARIEIEKPFWRS